MSINVIFMNLPKGSHGASTMNEDGSLTVFLDPRDSTPMQQSGYRHELRHYDHGDFENIQDKDVQQIEKEAHKKAPGRP